MSLRSVYLNSSQTKFEPTVQVGAGSWGGHVPSDLESFIQFSESVYREKPFPDYYYRCLDLLHEVEDKMKCSKISVRECIVFNYAQLW